MNTWAVIGCDEYGVTVERTGPDPSVADDVASWAQQEEDRWPEMGLIYMLIPPDEVPLARALEEDSARSPSDDGSDVLSAVRRVFGRPICVLHIVDPHTCTDWCWSRTVDCAQCRPEEAP